MTRKRKPVARPSKGPRRGRGRGGSSAEAGLEAQILAALTRGKRKYSQRAKLAASVRADAAAFDAALDALIARGEIVEAGKDRLALPSRLDLVSGRLRVGRRGKAVVIPDVADAPISVAAARLRPAMNGDLVLVEVAPFRSGARGLRSGKLKKVVERGRTHVIGTYVAKGGPRLEPADPAFGYVVVLKRPPADLKPGMSVSARILEYPDSKSDVVAEVEEVLGASGTLATEIRMICQDRGIPEGFADAVEREAASFEEPGASDRRGRSDLRGDLTVTIDGADAKDFDDAVSIETTSDGWKLTVSIADVSHYVRPGSALDTAAYERATSTYFPGRAVPMLPETISNGLASLRPSVDRLAVSALLHVNRTGKVGKTTFMRSVIRSDARLTYEQVESALGGNPVPGITPPTLTALQEMGACARAIGKQRDRRGSLDLDVPEPAVELDENGKPSAIHRRPRLFAHRLIEEFMVAANEAVARRLEKAGVGFLYRVHERPDADSIDNLVPRLRALGLRLPNEGLKLEPRAFQTVLASPAAAKAPRMVNLLVLRALMRARYSPHKEMHFGLASTAYCHFTSPIRRYPDLVVHRALTAVLEGKADRLPSATALEPVGDHCSTLERRSTEAEREADKIAAVIFMLDHVGEVFEGTIGGAERFGLFVELDEPFVEGFVPAGRLTEYYDYIPERMALESRRTGSSYTIGDKIRVKVTAVDLPTRSIDFVPVSEPGKTAAGPAKRRANKPAQDKTRRTKRSKRR